jgi:antitoxin HigA-1
MPRVRTHPGEVSREEHLVPLGMSARALAKAIGVPANRITMATNSAKCSTISTAVRPHVWDEIVSRPGQSRVPDA